MADNFGIAYQIKNSEMQRYTIYIYIQTYSYNECRIYNRPIPKIEKQYFRLIAWYS